MKRILLLALLIGAGTFALNAQTIKDGNVELRPASGFKHIQVSGGFEVFISSGTEESVAVSAAKQEYRDDIQVEVSGGTLKISYRPKKRVLWSSTGNLKLRAYISYKTLESVDVSGATGVRFMDTWKGEKGSLEASGASEIRGSVELDVVKVDISGASDVTLSGKTGKLVLEASGASDFKGYDLKAEIANLEVSGASDAKVTAEKELQVRASGASSVNYKGEASIREIRSSGASSVKKK